jgi:hypothetical protein
MFFQPLLPGAGQLQSGGSDQELTQSSRFDNASSFYSHTVAPGAVTLSQSSSFTDADSFFSHTVTQGNDLAQSSRFDDADLFYNHTVTPGATTLTQTALYTNPDEFFTHNVAIPGAEQLYRHHNPHFIVKDGKIKRNKLHYFRFYRR